ncbi:uncharacterized protein TNCV_1879131 [Trichonephila clavipes]|nr:uncharacterized protein TNCV_1879131 [Trichonephila clavipes]
MLIGRTIESSRCGRPRWHGIRVIIGEAPVGGEHQRGSIPRKARGNTKIRRTPQIKSQSRLLGGGCFPVPIGLTWQHDILVLKPSACLHNGNEADDWIDEWNSWFKSHKSET